MRSGFINIDGEWEEDDDGIITVRLTFEDVGYYGYLWTRSTESNSSGSYYLDVGTTRIGPYYAAYRGDALSLRCLSTVLDR